MKRGILAFTVSLFLLTSLAYAQAPGTLWTRTYGIPDQVNVCWEAIGTSDGGLVIAGATGLQGYMSWLYIVRINSDGDTLWTRTFADGSGALAISLTADNNFIVSGIIATSAIYPYVLKIDPDGNEIWSRIYTSWPDAYLRSCVPVGGDGYILAGYVQTDYISDMMLVRIDAAGDTLWSRTYGGFQDDRAWSARPTSDGGFIIAGWTESFGVSGSDFYIIKTHQNGAPFWTRTYGHSGNQEAREIMEIPEGGFVFSGKSSMEIPSVYYFMKITPLGDSSWAFTDTVNTYRAVVHSFTRTIDGGYALIGYSASSIDVFKIISVGELSWSKTFTDNSVNYRYSRSIVQSGDGSYFLCGSNNFDIWVIKLAPDVTGTDDDIAELPDQIKLLQNYPNPFNASTSISFELSQPGDITLTVYDLLGRKVSVLADGYLDAGSHSLIYNADELTSGIYFYNLKAGEYSETKSMILLK